MNTARRLQVIVTLLELWSRPGRTYWTNIERRRRSGDEADHKQEIRIIVEFDDGEIKDDTLPLDNDRTLVALAEMLTQ